jgi:hypothetical protein
MPVAGCIVGAVIVAVGGFILMILVVPGFGYAVLGITLALAILAAIWFFYWRKKRHRSLLPTSAQQTGDASDIRSTPDANDPAFTLGHGRGESVVLPPPPPAVMRGIDNRGSYLGRPVTHSPKLLPMYMDGTDR